MNGGKGLRARMNSGLRKLHDPLTSRQPGRSSEEIAQLEQAAKNAPRSKAAWMNLGRAYDRAFQFEKALECKRKAAELSPNDPEVSYSLGCSFCSKGDFLSATKSFEEALKLKPDFLEACEAIAEQYQILGKPGKADEWLLKADRIRFGKQN